LSELGEGVCAELFGGEGEAPDVEQADEPPPKLH
jgi:hypothetical protein